MAKKITARNVADYFLATMSEECGDTISNLKVQKLVYYAQGFHLAVTGKPLFGESIEAWLHGPVVPSLYRSFKQYGDGAIPKPTDFDFNIFSKEQRDLLDEVNRIYGQFSGWKLRNMTHEEPPWKNAAQDSIISHESLKKYFKTRIEE